MKKIEIEMGTRFHRLTVIGEPKKDKRGRSKYLCQCDCGQTKLVESSDLRAEKTKSCGCLKKELSTKHADIEVGTRFHRLTVIGEMQRNQRRKAYPCRCDCGKTKLIQDNNLRSGTTRSCGCLSKETRTRLSTVHGLSKNPLYSRWFSMINRCTNPKNKNYLDYGARGITVCDRWLESFENFSTDMGELPTPKHTIERIDNDKGYSPENCRWATRTEQASNRRRNRSLTLGCVTLTLSQWSRETGLKRELIRDRLNAGWSVERALTTPPNPKPSRRKNSTPKDLM